MLRIVAVCRSHLRNAFLLDLLAACHVRATCLLSSLCIFIIRDWVFKEGGYTQGQGSMALPSPKLSLFPASHQCSVFQRWIAVGRRPDWQSASSLPVLLPLGRVPFEFMGKLASELT